MKLINCWYFFVLKNNCNTLQTIQINFVYFIGIIQYLYVNRNNKVKLFWYKCIKKSGNIQESIKVKK